LQLIDRNLLTLETRVIPYLGLEGTRIADEVTIFHLLTHTSGIADDCEEENGEIYEDLWKTRPNYAVRNTADFLPQFVHKQPNFAPGQGCRYCNCSFVLLGLMIEHVTGMTYRDYVRAHIFKPAGMTRSDFFDMALVNEQVAEGCDPLRGPVLEPGQPRAAGAITGWKRNIYSHPPVGSPDSGAYVTARDLDRFLRAVQAGSLLSPELTEAFLTPKVDYRQKDSWLMRYGFCLWFYVEPDGRVVCYQKEGSNAGVSGMVRYFPAQDINVVILSNMEEGAWEPVWKIHELVVSGAFAE